jgi:hypothetical protein
MGGVAVTLGVLGLIVGGAGFVPYVDPRAATSLEVLGGGLIAGAISLLGLGFIAELVVHALPPTRTAPPIAEEVSFEASLTVGTSLALVEGGAAKSSPETPEPEDVAIDVVA